MVLATDMSVHFAICKDMKVMLAEDADPEEYVHNVLADYCYTGQPRYNAHVRVHKF